MGKGISLRKNAVYNIIKTCSSVIFPLITFPYISRILLPENVGKVDFSNSIVSYFMLIATLGITTYAVRECAARKNDIKELEKKASEIYSINIIMTIIAYILLFFSIFLFKRLESYRTLILIQSLVIVMTTIGAEWINMAMEDFRYITLRTFIFQIISIVLMFTLVRNKDDYYIYAIITVISSAGAYILNVFYRRKYCKLSFTLKLNLKENMKPILVLFVMILAQNIFNNADKTMLGLMINNYEVGIYSTAVKITNIIGQVVTSILWVVMPQMSVLFQNKDYTKINSLLRKIFGFTINLGLPCIVGVIMKSSSIILIIAGKEYIQASTVLKILMIALLFRFFGGCFIGNTIMLPLKKEKYFMEACLISTVSNIVLNCFFIPWLGAGGAAITTTISEFIILIYLLPKVDNGIVIENKIRMFISPLIGCLSIVAVCLFVSRAGLNIYIDLVLSVVLSSTIYFLVLFMLKNEYIMEICESIKNIFKK